MVISLSTKVFQLVRSFVCVLAPFFLVLLVHSQYCHLDPCLHRSSFLFFLVRECFSYCSILYSVILIDETEGIVGRGGGA